MKQSEKEQTWLYHSCLTQLTKSTQIYQEHFLINLQKEINTFLYYIIMIRMWF